MYHSVYILIKLKIISPQFLLLVDLEKRERKREMEGAKEKECASDRTLRTKERFYVLVEREKKKGKGKDIAVSPFAPENGIYL